VLRTRVETALCAVFAVLTVLTIAWPEWIEGLTGLEPDGGNGSLEWLIVLLFGLITVGLGLRARYDYRQVRLRATSGASTEASAR
jgi:hypothetical protein